MASTKLKTVSVMICLLVSPFALKGQCNKVKEEEKDFIVFPKVFFSSSARQVQRFLSSNPVVEDKSLSRFDKQCYPWNNTCYLFVHTMNTWEEAVDACRSMEEGAHLVFIESDAENQELSRLAKVESAGQETRWWIGLTDKKSEGNWKWYNVSVNYTNWNEGNPDNSNDNENCGELVIRSNNDNARWNENRCTRRRSFICEINETAIT